MIVSTGFKTMWGTAAIGGLHVLPLWLYAYRTGYLSAELAMPMWAQLSGIAAFTVGRVVCLFVEVGWSRRNIALHNTLCLLPPSLKTLSAIGTLISSFSLPVLVCVGL